MGGGGSILVNIQAPLPPKWKARTKLMGPPSFRFPLTDEVHQRVSMATPLRTSLHQHVSATHFEPLPLPSRHRVSPPPFVLFSPSVCWSQFLLFILRLFVSSRPRETHHHSATFPQATSPRAQFVSSVLQSHTLYGEKSN